MKDKLAKSLMALGRYCQAGRVLNSVIQADPRNAKAHADRAQVFINLKKFEKAKQAAEAGLALMPPTEIRAELLQQLGWALLSLGQSSEALDRMKEAVASSPSLGSGHLALSFLWGFLGNSQSAISECFEALQLDPKLSEAYLQLIRFGTFPIDSPIDPKIVEIFSELPRRLPALPDVEQAAGWFALGDFYERMGEVDRAFERFCMGAQIQRRGVEFNMNQFRAVISQCLQRKPRPRQGNHKTDQGQVTPVFIVGMPGSGISLVERMLGGHPKVFAGGELCFLPELIRELSRKSADIKSHSDLDRYDVLAQRYFKRAHNLITAASLPHNPLLITDTSALNYRYIDLIRDAFPAAKIIHVRRHPMATCFSAFTSYFPMRSMRWSYDLNEVAEHYHLYHKLMTHWKAQLGESFLELHYEDVIRDPESEIQKLLTFMALPFDESCFHLQTIERPFFCTNCAQIRRPLYKHSIDRWKRYEAHLKPLKEALAGVSTEYEKE